ncbi:monocarboxylate uptake permease MctP [Labrys wisconsinensis]|uniref:SSS family solute:Na+ symporter n=1 Tax=Labrys wisconsinensis TaxID=425677 RepID=A0ABU0JIC6_9HYPH|nr:sodium:solute symporter family protein [Labrys wisconsinensis]MDQ0474033.1 SSS family solute:Na+ symporter [Labrys wisconsinensis]
MIDNLNWTATAVFIALFALVTVLGFVAARWKAGNLDELHEWGLGGRRFGAWITWFLLGGDLYTAYTVIAVPALVYAIGAYGFFAVPYTILIYPLVFVTMPRLWNVAHKKGYITGADFIYGRYGSKGLELAVAFTGILATMPYIALQLVGMEKVIQALGFQGQGLMSHAPLTIAFVILALYTYKSGLRAPAMIAFVKDIMIYVFVIAAVVIIPAQLGGYGAIFEAAGKVYAAKAAATPNVGLTLTPAQVSPFITLAIGSAMALFMYPHSMTGVLSASGPGAIRRNAMTLPAYSLVLGLIALLGFMAHAAGIQVANPQDAIPQLVLKMFPAWFAGFCFAAIAIGALVPAAVMSIGAANTFTRNVWRPFVEPGMSPQRESYLAKLMSLIVKVGALVVILFMPTKFALDLQLLGGVWMIQIFPAIVLGLYTRWYSGTALLIGWAVGFVLGTWLSWGPAAWVPTSVIGGFGAYNGLIALAANVAVATVVSLVARSVARDETAPADFEDARSPA